MIIRDAIDLLIIVDMEKVDDQDADNLVSYLQDYYAKECNQKIGFQDYPKIYISKNTDVINDRNICINFCGDFGFDYYEGCEQTNLSPSEPEEFSVYAQYEDFINSVKEALKTYPGTIMYDGKLSRLCDIADEITSGWEDNTFPSIEDMQQALSPFEPEY